MTSLMPVSGRKPDSIGAGGGAESHCVRAMKNADATNDRALTTNATFRPAIAVTMPPTDAPSASIADHVALESAFAGRSSPADVTLGIVAVRAGSKNACAPTITAITTYAIH